MSEKIFTTYEIAQYCHVTPRTVVQWINEGKLKAFRTAAIIAGLRRKNFWIFCKDIICPSLQI